MVEVVANIWKVKRLYTCFPDRDFINSIVDHVLSIEKSKIVIQRGNYDSWEKNKNLEDQYELEKNEKLRK